MQDLQRFLEETEKMKNELQQVKEKLKQETQTKESWKKAFQDLEQENKNLQTQLINQKNTNYYRQNEKLKEENTKAQVIMKKAQALASKTEQERQRNKAEWIRIEAEKKDLENQQQQLDDTIKKEVDEKVDEKKRSIESRLNWKQTAKDLRRSKIFISGCISAFIVCLGSGWWYGHHVRTKQMEAQTVQITKLKHAKSSLQKRVEEQNGKISNLSTQVSQLQKQVPQKQTTPKKQDPPAKSFADLSKEANRLVDIGNTATDSVASENDRNNAKAQFTEDKISQLKKDIKYSSKKDKITWGQELDLRNKCHRIDDYYNFMVSTAR